MFVVACFIGALTTVQLRLKSRKITVSQTTSTINKHKQGNSCICIPERYSSLPTQRQAKGQTCRFRQSQPVFDEHDRADPPRRDPLRCQRCAVPGYAGSHLICDVTQGDTTQRDALHGTGRCPQEAYTP